MNYYHLVFASSLYFLPQLSLGQTGLSISTNSPRHADLLCKVEIPYVDVGDRGEDIVWPLGEVNDDCKDYLQLINSNADTIAIYEEGRILHYLVKGDTLQNKGVQSRRAYQIYSHERPLLRYPFQYGDSIWGDFSGDGRYENSRYSVTGFGYTVADGTGCLTDGEDTLRHVIRLHQLDEYVQDFGKDGSECFQEECYRWYCAGYRYAVMESKVTSVYIDNVLIPVDSVSYLYLPVKQMELAGDEDNEQLLAMIASADAAQSQSSSGNDIGVLSQISASLSTDGLSLVISYRLDARSEISFIACDILGNLVASSHYQNKETGDWQECLILSRRPIGNALMLNIRCGSQQMSMKVTQENI